MWVLLMSRVRRYILLSLVLPLLGRLAGALGRRLERRRGRTTPVSRLLVRIGGLGRRKRAAERDAPAAVTANPGTAIATGTEGPVGGA